MAKTLQFRRDTTSNLSSVSGAVGELFVDLDKDTLVVMDGSTAGGFPLQKELQSGTNIKTINGNSILGSGDISISGGGGSSFDQDLNTTDDVVFNSALVGDVSIIGNEISGVDSYGNSSELLINAPLTVNAGGTSSNTVLYTDTLTGAGYMYQNSGAAPIIIGFPYENVKELFRALNPGDTFTLRVFSTNELLTYTFKNMIESGTGSSTELSINVEEENYGLTINFSQNYLELNYNVNTLVNVLEVSESGVSVDGTLTTDTLLATDALIGDVSIVGNTIAAIDSYGSASDLGVSASSVTFDQNLNLSVDSTASTTEEVNGGMQNFGFSTDINNDQIFVYGGNNSWQDSSKFVTGSIVTLVSPMYNTTVIATLTSNLVYSNTFFQWRADCTIISGDASSNPTADSVTVTNSSGSLANYTFDDQGTLTSTNLIADSALVGDVSIIGNTITGVDSYGVADTLVVDSALDVNGTLNVTNTSSTTTTYSYGQWDGQISWFMGNVQWQEPSVSLSIVNSLKAGDTLTFVDSMNVGNYITVTLTSAMTYNPGFMAYAASVVENNNTGMPIGAGNDFLSITSSFQVNPLSVTASGVSVDGTFTVNGLSVGVAYDQSLNTTDDVVFNSALVGDVSIVDNTITGVDSYGNPDTLVVDGNLNVQFDILVPVTETIPSGSGYIITNIFAPGTFEVDLFVSLEGIQWAEASKFVAGTTITMATDGGIVEFELTSDLTWRPEFGFWTAGWVIISGDVNGQLNASIAVITNMVSNTADVLQVTETGAAITGALTVNGQAITAGTSYDQSLNTTDDVVFNSALVGDVSIIGNTITGVDSYGLAGDLVLDGTVVYTGTTDETPSNTSTVNKWLKVGSEVTIPGTVTSYNFLADVDYLSVLSPFSGVSIAATGGGYGYVIFRNYDSWPNYSSAQLTKNLAIGTEITFTADSSTYVGTLTSRTASINETQYDITWISPTNIGPLNTGGAGPASVSFSITGPASQGIDYFYMPLYQ